MSNEGKQVTWRYPMVDDRAIVTELTWDKVSDIFTVYRRISYFADSWMVVADGWVNIYRDFMPQWASDTTRYAIQAVITMERQ